MDSRKLEKMGRRRFMENLAGVGVSATTLKYLEQDGLADITEDPEKEVPYVSRWKNIEKEPGNAPIREPIYDTIPREEWERRQTAMALRDQVDQKLDEILPGQPIYAAYTGLEESPTDFGVKIKVAAYSNGVALEEVENLFPTTASVTLEEDNSATREDIPIIVEDEESGEFCIYVTKNYDPIPGGQRVLIGNNQGTLLGAFHSNQYGDGWITAGHVAESEGKLAYEQGDYSLIFGSSKDVVHSGYVDCAFIKKDGQAGQAPTDKITSPDNSSLDLSVRGYVSDESLNYHVDDTSYQIDMQGRDSCRKSGHINATRGSGTKQVEISEAMSDGDSGGPMFRVPSTGDAYIVGDIVGPAGTFGYDTRGTTIETIEDALDGYVY